MDMKTLQNVSGLLSEAKNKLMEMDVSEWDEDTVENWTYEIDNVESEIDIIIDGYEQGKWK